MKNPPKKLSRRRFLLASGGAVVLAGCGGGSSENPDTRTTTQVSVLWYPPTRLTAASIARSARISLISAKGGDSVSLLAVRPTPIPATEVPYPFVDRIATGPATLTATFHTGIAGDGDLVATASAEVTISAAGALSESSIAVTGDVQRLLLFGLPSKLTVGEIYSPTLGAIPLERSGFNIAALPEDSVTWQMSGPGLQREGQGLAARAEGQYRITASITRTDGTTVRDIADVIVLSQRPANTKTLLPFYPFAMPLIDGKLTGLSLSKDAVLFVDPATDVRESVALPGADFSVSPDFEHGCVWLFRPDTTTIWRLDLRSRQLTTFSDFTTTPYEFQFRKIYPFPGSPTLLLVEEQLNQGGIYQISVHDGVRIPTDFVTSPAPQLTTRDNIRFDLRDFSQGAVKRYQSTTNGIQLLQTANAPWSGGTVYDRGRLLASDGSVRNSETLELVTTLATPPWTYSRPRFSPSGRRALFFGTLKNTSEAIVVTISDVETGKTLREFWLSHSDSQPLTKIPDVFFLDETSIGIVETNQIFGIPDSLTVLPNLLIS